MIGIVTFQSAFVQRFKYPYGKFLTQISNDSNLTDIIVCQNVIYQILQNGTIQALGKKSSLLGNRTGYDFVNLNIMNAKKLYCYLDLYLWYITTTDELYLEQYTHNGSSIFTQSLEDEYVLARIPIHNIKQIVGDSLLQFVLTSSSIYVTGTQSVRYIFSGNYTGIEETYLKLPLILNASNIESIDLTPSMAYLFVYMNNGDVYALGDNTKGVLTTADSKCERKIGTNITRVSVGYNHTRQQMTMYYMQNNILYLYDAKAIDKQVLIQDQVFDYQLQDYYQLQGSYNQQKNTIIISNQSIIEISEDIKLYTNGTDYYCARNTTDPRCVKQLKGEDTQCYTNGVLLKTEPFCNLLDCNNPVPDPSSGNNQNYCFPQSCPGAQATNITCQAVVCFNQALYGTFIPQCTQTYINHTYINKFTNSSMLSFVNGLLYTNQSTPSIPEVTPSKQDKLSLSIGAVAGVTAGGCAIVFIIVFTSVVYCYKRNTKRSLTSVKIINESTKNSKQVNKLPQIESKQIKIIKPLQANQPGMI
ncbi:Regulator_of chromosome condensation 1/beta-lactamase-inhibitor protein II [Hexamita inflata]|uniref:Regulator of chromosome condensation 1/beta-lactamase-inhibitor protein II n=1 Tax=Hexamita inflata TaxID=28002 RepID=A0AA86P9K1_9EUKA|nr:Regulator of chromosome condensation 1/beta-lactamase-inhibitor protein II [Hexamita inflata]